MMAWRVVAARQLQLQLTANSRTCASFFLKIMRQSSSKAWMKRHVNDKYVKEAKSSNYRSRSAFKLLEIQEKHKIFRLGDK
mmetsp:Transcript_12267/g.21853  ORF Transcript_12267/g.21853 Transcript_12267/m.21853 type:complete len:81 (+) Transcript_12267:3-245(+)